MNKKLTSQPQNTVPRVFPVFSSNPKGPNFGLYCKYQLLRYKPWQTTQGKILGDNPMARVNARHSSDLARKASPDEMAGLEPCVFLAKGAQVMLTMNSRKRKLTGLHDSYSSWNLYICRFLFGLSTFFFCSFTLV